MADGSFELEKRYSYIKQERHVYIEVPPCTLARLGWRPCIALKERRKPKVQRYCCCLLTSQSFLTHFSGDTLFGHTWRLSCSLLLHRYPSFFSDEFVVVRPVRFYRVTMYKVCLSLCTRDLSSLFISLFCLLQRCV